MGEHVGDLPECYLCRWNLLGTVLVFVTTGSQQFQFDRLLRAVDECVSSGVIDDGVFAQIGHCNYEPKNFEFARFLSRSYFSEKMSMSDVVITHGGTGSIVTALKQGKKVIAMPRLVRFGEHVDDHQVQLLEQFAEAKLILICMDAKSLEAAYLKALKLEFSRYVSSNEDIIADIDEYLSRTGERQW